MKRVITFTIIIMALMTVLLQHAVYATGDITINKTAMNIIKGKTDTFKITATNAAGKVNIVSSDTNVISVSKDTDWLDNSELEITITAVNVGTATVTVTVEDASTYDEEDLSSKSYKINVTVTEENANTSDDEDTSGPIIIGVEDGETYSEAVTIDAKDESDINTESVVLKKDGKVVEGFKLGDTVSENGTYEITVSDVKGNKTVVTFTIKKNDNTNNTDNNNNSNSDDAANVGDNNNANTTNNNTNSNNTNNNTSNSNNKTNTNSNTNKTDNSTSDSKLPHTGIRKIAFIVIIIAIVEFIIYKKYKKYNSI